MKLSQNALAERAEMSFRGLQDIEYEKVWPEWETIVLIAKALNVSETELFQDASFMPAISPQQALKVISDLVQEKSSKS